MNPYREPGRDLDPDILDLATPEQVERAKEYVRSLSPALSAKEGIKPLRRWLESKPKSAKVTMRASELLILVELIETLADLIV